MSSGKELTYPQHLELMSLPLSDGVDASDCGLDSQWRVLNTSLVLGWGDECFEQAVERLFSFSAHRFAGVNVTGTAAEGEVLRLNFGPTRSPCLVLRAERTSPSRAFLIYGTLPGHVERGEEAFIIDKDAQGRVVGRCVAFSQHAWWLAKLGAPVARAVQNRITCLYLQGMRGD